MKQLLRTRVFAAAFFLLYAAYFALTLDVQRPGFGVGHVEYGFPFTYYYSHCFGGHYLWLGLIGNAAFAGTLSIAFGLWAAHLARKLSTPEFRAKWYL